MADTTVNWRPIESAPDFIQRWRPDFEVGDGCYRLFARSDRTILVRFDQDLKPAAWSELDVYSKDERAQL